MDETENHILKLRKLKWEKQNFQAIKEFNKRIKQIGVFSDKIRKF